MMAALSEEQKKQFATDGYCVIPDFASPEEVKELIAQADKIVQGGALCCSALTESRTNSIILSSRLLRGRRDPETRRRRLHQALFSVLHSEPGETNRRRARSVSCDNDLVLCFLRFCMRSITS